MRLRREGELVSDAAISFRGVTKRYGAQKALHPTDLEILEGEFFCLLGPSGCGKTTTLNLVGGFIGPTTGEILIRGENVNRLPPYRRAVNTVFQNYALFPHMNVHDNVGFGLKMARISKRDAGTRIDEALALVGLEEFADRLPTQLSGGQQQRVAVARALVNRPAVLLLDEPLGALDLKLRKRLQIELAQIHRDVGTTFVYVTHDQEEAMSMATRIAVMNDGRIEQVGTPHEIYHRPTSAFVADFIGESNFIEVDVGAEGRAALDNGAEVPAPAHERTGRATLMVRPESIQVRRPADSNGTGLRGRIAQSSFLGSHTRVAVNCDGVTLPVTAALFGMESAAASELQPETEVVLTWDPADVVVLEGDPRKEEDVRDN
jgi:spermidine/putrescine ABC transporter ATP-binding subunit